MRSWRRFKLIIAALLLGAACGPQPAREFNARTDENCLLLSQCWLNRASSPDFLFSSPGYGRFLDDYLELVVEADGGTRSGYSWRHGMSGSALVNARFGDRHGLAVNGRSEIAVSSDTILWGYHQDGTPLFVFAFGGEPIENPPEGSAPYESYGFGGNVVAFADDDHVWSATTLGAPFLANLTDVNIRRGPLIEFSWELDFEQNASWLNKSASVLSDGTLIWNRFSGSTVALSPDGGVKWLSDAGSGPFTISDDGRVFSFDFFNRKMVAMDAQTGTALLRLEEPDWRIESSFLEGSYIGDRFTVMDPFKLGLVTIDSHSAAIVASLEFDGGWFADEISSTAYYAGDITMARDNSVYVSTDSTSRPKIGNKLMAYSPDLELRWSVRHAFLSFVVPSETFNRVYVVAGDYDNLDAGTYDSHFSLYGFDSMTGAELFSYPLTGRADYAPVLKDGVLYLTTLTSTPDGEVAPSSMNGRLRRDGGVIDAEADYQCLWLDHGSCLPFKGGPSSYFRVVWAFPVE